MVYRLPELRTAPRVVAALAGGWWIGSIVTYQSGLPITPTLGTNRSRSGVDGGAANVDRPDWAPGRGPDNAVTGNINQWIDPTAFTVPAVGTLGNVGRNSLRGPSLFSVDMSFNKDTRAGFLGAAGLVQFRLEVFNILNTPLFALPSGTVFSPLPTTCPQGGCPVGAANTATTVAPVPNVGRITSTAATSRQIQLALKFVF